MGADAGAADSTDDVGAIITPGEAAAIATIIRGTDQRVQAAFRVCPDLQQLVDAFLRLAHHSVRLAESRSPRRGPASAAPASPSLHASRAKRKSVDAVDSPRLPARNVRRELRRSAAAGGSVRPPRPSSASASGSSAAGAGSGVRGAAGSRGCGSGSGSAGGGVGAPNANVEEYSRLLRNVPAGLLPQAELSFLIRLLEHRDPLVGTLALSRAVPCRACLALYLSRALVGVALLINKCGVSRLQLLGAFVAFEMNGDAEDFVDTLRRIGSRHGLLLSLLSAFCCPCLFLCSV